MKLFLITLCICYSTLAFSQKRKTDLYIEQLNNNQFIIDHSQKASFKMNSPAAFKLMKIGKSASEKLIKTLSDSSRIIMAHLVLSHIYFKKVSFAGPKTLVTNNGDMNKYFLGEEKAEGLVLTETTINESYQLFITPGDRDEIINYWKKKIIAPKKTEPSTKRKS